MNTRRASLEGRRLASRRCGLAAQRSLGQDCALYFRNLAVAAIIFLPVWTFLYLLRPVLLRHW